MTQLPLIRRNNGPSSRSVVSTQLLIARSVSGVIPGELSNVRCHNVDVVAPAVGSWKERRVLAQLLAEIVGGGAHSEPIVAYRGNERWVPEFVRTRVEAPSVELSRLKTGGVYLITGGLATPPQNLKQAVIDPFLEFFKRQGAIVILLFILFFKIGDSMVLRINLRLLALHLRVREADNRGDLLDVEQLGIEHPLKLRRQIVFRRRVLDEFLRAKPDAPMPCDDPQPEVVVFDTHQ